MIMNSQIREELTALLADHLTMAESSRILRGERPKTPWDRWHLVAADAMEFIYGDETSPVEADSAPSGTGDADSPACCGGFCGCGRCGNVAGLGGVDSSLVEPFTLTGVFGPPTTPGDLLASQYVQYLGDALRSQTEESGPAQGSDSEQSAPSAQEPDSAA